MIECVVCDKKFSHQSNLNRHQRNNTLCNKLKKKLEKIERLQYKCDRLKNAVKDLIEKNNILETTNQDLVQTTITHEKEIQQLNDDRNLLYHQLEVAKGRLEEKAQANNQIVEVAKQNKVSTNNTVINNNNTVIINDFRIKSADEFDESRKEELIEYIRNKEVSYVYQWLLELLYWTKPPNISIRDQSRKKVMILRENKWIQENVDILVHRMFYRTIKPIVMNCIEEQIDEYEELIKEPENKNNEEMRDELMIWEEIHNLWSRYDHKRLNQPFLQTVSNLQNHNKLLNIN